MKLADAANLKAAKDWEHSNHGNGVPGVGSWWGHCPGWTGAAMANAPVEHAVDAKLVGGKFVACTAGSTGCTQVRDRRHQRADGRSLRRRRLVVHRRALRHRAHQGQARQERPHHHAGLRRRQPGHAAHRRLGAHEEGAPAASPSTRRTTSTPIRSGTSRPTATRSTAISRSPAAQAANLVVNGKMTGDRDEAIRTTRRRRTSRSSTSRCTWVSERGPNTDMVSGLESSPSRRAWSPSSSSTSRPSNRPRDHPRRRVPRRQVSVGADRLDGAAVPVDHQRRGLGQREHLGRRRRAQSVHQAVAGQAADRARSEVTRPTHSVALVL